MNIKRLITCILTVFCLTSLFIPHISAAELASDQIASYGMSATLGSGTINVEFHITGNGTMNKLGCEYIYIYEKNGTSWDDYTYRTEYNTGMSKYNSHVHTNVIELPCSDNKEYKVVVTVFAENDEGRDSRTDVFYL